MLVRCGMELLLLLNDGHIIMKIKMSKMSEMDGRKRWIKVSSDIATVEKRN